MRPRVSGALPTPRRRAHPHPTPRPGSVKPQSRLALPPPSINPNRSPRPARRSPCTLAAQGRPKVCSRLSLLGAGASAALRQSRRGVLGLIGGASSRKRRGFPAKRVPRSACRVRALVGVLGLICLITGTREGRSEAGRPILRALFVLRVAVFNSLWSRRPPPPARPVPAIYFFSAA